ncbi:ATP-binding cassette domain-containing protein [Sulfuracidifex tepidarius]|uniref:ABC transporter domain-containing protein n=1 Tax=Sulfuracidifex tepidarius TaxID=1294262 RepID=A0A510E5A9_9CREN|nr:ATP-binding cassette domain-containing protein [Sulfuracidifex tepidarius]BBG27627.1 hypothetical protein IC007_2181 [Sulfuracidifex tepidarius]
MIPLLSALHVSKKYFSEVLHDITFKVDKERVGVIGLHSSGKSVLLSILSGIEKPTSGKVLLDERPLNPSLVAYIPQAPLFDPLMKVKEVCKGSDVEGERRLGSLSLLEKKKVAFCMTPEAEYLVYDDFDEPLTDLVKGFKGGVVLSSVSPSKVWNVIDKVIVLSRGRVVFSGNKESLNFKVIRFRDGKQIRETWERSDSFDVEKRLNSSGVKYDVIEASPDEAFWMILSSKGEERELG